MVYKTQKWPYLKINKRFEKFALHFVVAVKPTMGLAMYRNNNYKFTIIRNESKK